MQKNNKAPQIRFAGFTDDWEQRKLGEITISFSGGTPIVGNKEYYNGKIPFIRSGEINSDKTELFISQSGLENSSAKLIKKGDILYALYGATSGEVGRSKIDGAINQAILAIIPDEKNDPEFIAQWLRKHKSSIIQTYLQGGQGNLSGEIVKNLMIIKPKSSEEQTAIGNFFKQLDETIALHQREYEKYKNLKISYLEKMFPKENEQFPKIRFPEFTDAWEQRKLGEIGTTFSGLTGKSKDDFGHGKAKYVTYLNVHSNCLTSNEMLDLIEIDDAQNQVQKGDVFFTTSSEVPDEVGLSSVWTYDIPNVYLNSFCFAYRPNEKIDLNYLAYMLRSKNVRNQMILLAQGISRYNISKKSVMEINVYLPKYEEQTAIGNFFKQLDETIALHQRKCEKYKQIKQFYLERMFV